MIIVVLLLFFGSSLFACGVGGAVGAGLGTGGGVVVTFPAILTPHCGQNGA